MRAWQQIDGQWHVLKGFERCLIAHAIDDVLPTLRAIEAACIEEGYYAAGWISYDAAPAFDHALRARHRPGLPLLAFGLFTEAVATELPPAGDASLGDWEHGLDEAQHASGIATIHDWIAAGHTYQVNYTFPLRTSFHGDPFALLRRLDLAQRAAHGAYLEVGDLAICSASPELFFKRRGQQLTTRPMKGTAPRAPESLADRQAADALQRSQKDRAENVMIVDMLRNDLGRIATPGSVEVDKLFHIEQYPTVHQMTSEVRAHSEASLLDIFKALFPCASITGAPKARTMEIIHDLEPEARGIYTGTIGVIQPNGDADFNVAIRSVVINRRHDTAEYGVGGGIVWDSAAEVEWQECLAKTQVLKTPPPAFDLFETMRYDRGSGVANWAFHRQRLERSLRYFGRSAPLDDIATALNQLDADRPLRLRLLVREDGSHELEQHDLPPVATTPWTVPLDDRPIDPASPWLYHKTTRRARYDEARARFPDAPDVILWNPDQQLTETSIGNLVLELDDRKLTPPLHAGLLPGTFRAALLDAGEISEAPLNIDDLPRATRIWMINSLRGWVELQIKR